MIARSVARLLLCTVSASILISPTFATESGVLDRKKLTTCTSLKTGSQFISKTGNCNKRIYETRVWYLPGETPKGTVGSKLISVKVCTSKKTKTQTIRRMCNSKTQLSTTFQRNYGPPAALLAPTAAAASLGSASISFIAPEKDGGARITSYKITSNPGSITKTVELKDMKSVKIGGITPGVTYRFSVTATNSQGESVPSELSNSILAPNLPDAPTISSVVLIGDNSARLVYTAPAFDGGSPITDYEAVITSSGTPVSSRVVSSGVLELSHLPYSMTLTLSLIAKNIAGSSPASTASSLITTAAPPPPPRPTPTPSAAPILAAPAFTISASSEIRQVNTAATGFTVTSTAGAIASYAISPAAPSGMSFNTETGAFSGTPIAVQSATTYTITATNASGSSTRTFSFTVSSVVISVAAIAGVTAPINGATPVNTVTAGNGYTGTVTWAVPTGTFASATVYAATITLSPDSGYTLTGVTENFFTVAGTTSVTHSANSGVVTAVFPATATTISVAAIAGVTAPVTGATPATTTTAGTGYTGTVTWSGALTAGKFVAATVYTATITLSPDSGYTLTGVTENFFTVEKATPVTHPANSGVITAVFYMVGSSGPGGGTIYYYDLAGFNCGENYTDTGSSTPAGGKCHYLEVAQRDWDTPTVSITISTDPSLPWAQTGFTTVDVPEIDNESSVNNSAAGVGLGLKNSIAIVNRAGSPTAASTARAYKGGSLEDWYLPTIPELNLLCQWVGGQTQNVDTRGNCNANISTSGLDRNLYWTSSERQDNQAWAQTFSTGAQNNYLKNQAPRVRPVRAF